MLNLKVYLHTLQTGALLCKVYKTKKKYIQKKKAIRFMQDDGIGGRYREKSPVGKEAWSCARYGRGHRTEVVRNNVGDLMSITHGCQQLTPLSSNNVTQLLDHFLLMYVKVLWKGTYMHSVLIFSFKLHIRKTENWNSTDVKIRANILCSECHCIYQLHIYLIDFLLNFTWKFWNWSKGVQNKFHTFTVSFAITWNTWK